MQPQVVPGWIYRLAFVYRQKWCPWNFFRYWQPGQQTMDIHLYCSAQHYRPWQNGFELLKGDLEIGYVCGCSKSVSGILTHRNAKPLVYKRFVTFLATSLSSSKLFIVLSQTVDTCRCKTALENALKSAKKLWETQRRCNSLFLLIILQYFKTFCRRGDCCKAECGATSARIDSTVRAKLESHRDSLSHSKGLVSFHLSLE